MQTKTIERYFFFGLLLATLLFTFFIFRPFWIVLVLGASFAIILYPVYEWFNKGKFPHWLSAFITVFLFLLVLCGPLLGIGTIVFNQAQGVYHSIVQNGSAGTFLNSINDSINNFLPPSMAFDINEKASIFISYISSNVAKILGTTLSTFFSFILMLLSIFYFLKDGAQWRKAFVVLSPLADKDDEKIITRLSRAVNAVIKGYLLIALAQGLLMGIGLSIFGVPNAALWGVVTAFVSLVPSVGTAFVSVPAIIFLFSGGHTTSAIGMLIWAVAIVGMVDNFLSPMVVGGKTNLPPFLILFSVLGGISLLGPVGILVGPLSLSLLYTLISIYRNEYRQSVI